MKSTTQFSAHTRHYVHGHTKKTAYYYVASSQIISNIILLFLDDNIAMVLVSKTYRLGNALIVGTALHVERLDFGGKANEEDGFVDGVCHLALGRLGNVLSTRHSNIEQFVIVNVKGVQTHGSRWANQNNMIVK